MPNRGRKKKRAPTEKKKETKTSAKEKEIKTSEQEKEVKTPEEESQTQTSESEIETKKPEKENETKIAEEAHTTPANESKTESPVKEKETKTPEKEEETETPEKESESVRHIPRGTLKVWKVTKDTGVKEASPTVINLAGKTVTIKPLNVSGQNATQDSSGSNLSPTKLSPVKPGVSTPPIIGVAGGIRGASQLVAPALVRPVLLPTQHGVSLVRDKDGQQRILIPFMPNLLQPQSPVRQAVTAPSTQQKPRPKGRPPYRSYATLKNRASSSRKRCRSVSPASSIESISSLSSAPPSPPREASPAPSDSSVIIVDVVPSTKEGATLKRAVKTQDYMQEMYRSYRRRKRPRLARTCREILEECVKLSREINDKEYLRVLHRRLRKIRADMQSAASKEKNSKKEAQSKKKTPRKTTKASLSTPNGNVTDADKIVIESEGEKEDTEEVTLVIVSDIEGVGTSPSTNEVSKEPSVQTTVATRPAESDNSKDGGEEITQSRLSPMSKEVNAEEASGGIDAEEETPLVPASQEMNVDDNHTDSETEKQEAEATPNKTVTRGRDLSGSEDQTKPEAVQKITRGRDLSESEDQTESDTGTKGGRKKRGRPPKDKAKLAINPSNSDPGNQDKDVTESMERSGGGEPVGLADPEEGAEQSSSIDVTAKSVTPDSRNPTTSPRGTRRSKKSNDVSPAAAVVAATSPGRKRRKRGAEDAVETNQEDGREPTGEVSATPGDDETKPLVTSPSRKRRKRGAEDVGQPNQEESNETKGDTTATPGDDETEPKEQVTRKSRRKDRTAAVTEEPETTTAPSEPQEQDGESTPPAPSSVNKRKGRPPSKHLTGSKETEPQKKQRGYSLRKH